MSNELIHMGSGTRLDVDHLVAGRLLVQANSGGGKTRTLRRLLEQSHGALQHLVIDPEGEYHTLRERCDYVLASPSGGDTVAHPRSAKLLAERLLEMGVSAVLDIYELSPDARQAFVARFLDAVVNAPRALWHPTLVVLDEAHVYAPEGRENEATAAVKALASRGRKRGYCLVPATQRLAKLSKDVAAECNNKLIGRCTLDVDIKRAAEELGFTTAEQRQSLRQLEAGEFWAFGPAFDLREPLKTKIGPVKTTHAEAGQAPVPVRPPTATVKAVLAKLADLPGEVEKRERTMAALEADNRELRKMVDRLNAEQPVAPAPVSVLTDEDRKVLAVLRDDVLEVTRRLERLSLVATTPFQPAVVPSRSIHPFTGKVGDTIRVQISAGPIPNDGAIPGPALKILTSIAELRALDLYPADKMQVGLMSGYTNVKSGGFNTPLRWLVSSGLVETDGELVTLTAGGMIAAGTVHPPETAEDMQTRVMAKLTAPERKLLEAVISRYPTPITVDALGAECGYSNTKSGGFSAPLRRLRRLRLIFVEDRLVSASPALFLESTT